MELAALIHAVYNSHPRQKGQSRVTWGKVWSSLKPQADDVELPVTGTPLERLEKYKAFLRQQGKGPENNGQHSQPAG